MVDKLEFCRVDSEFFLPKSYSPPERFATSFESLFRGFLGLRIVPNCKFIIRTYFDSVNWKAAFLLTQSVVGQ